MSEVVPTPDTTEENWDADGGAVPQVKETEPKMVPSKPAEPVQPGDLYTVDETTYEITEKKFCGFVPVGVITSEVNKGVEVILVNAPHAPWSRF